jgi:hypothetical protein
VRHAGLRECEERYIDGEWKLSVYVSTLVVLANVREDTFNEAVRRRGCVNDLYFHLARLFKGISRCREDNGQVFWVSQIPPILVKFYALFKVEVPGSSLNRI